MNRAFKTSAQSSEKRKPRNALNVCCQLPHPSPLVGPGSHAVACDSSRTSEGPGRTLGWAGRGSLTWSYSPERREGLWTGNYGTMEGHKPPFLQLKMGITVFFHMLSVVSILTSSKRRFYLQRSIHFSPDSEHIVIECQDWKSLLEIPHLVKPIYATDGGKKQRGSNT